MGLTPNTTHSAFKRDDNNDDKVNSDDDEAGMRQQEREGAEPQLRWCKLEFNATEQIIVVALVCLFIAPSHRAKEQQGRAGGRPGRGPRPPSYGPL